MKLINIIKFTLALTLVLFLNVSAHATEAPMYEKLGGKEAISVVVDDFVTNIAGDKRINFQFANTDVPHIKAMLVDMMCMATGGPCDYKGRDMKSVHENMQITNAQFNAVAECLYEALSKNGVPYHMQNQIIAMLAPMQRDIVTK